MRALPTPLRKLLETAVLAARRASETASRAALDGLGVFLRDKPGHLDADQAVLRNGLRAKCRQFGDDRELLVAECAYEQWHRLLFARFLAENNLLLHPKFRAPVTLAECEDYAADLGEPDGWSVAARFAAEILPGIFRLDDPCVRLRLAPEGRHALEQILGDLPAGVFAADDALGWVYQFWQKDKKDEVNASERKIGGADLGPVTQLFTENYMVRFLLENSLGAWWAARHSDSPLVKGFEYLRFDDDSRPAGGSFDGWPASVAEVTVMDPCCGSGHFLVEAFSMLWQMRTEEEGLSPVVAQDSVLRDNLFGLELDPRCVQIAMFAVALQAWKAGGAWRPLPVPNIACSGIPVKAPVEEWKALGGVDTRLKNALVRLHILFRDADTFGSLIDPKRSTEITDPTGLQRSLADVDWDDLAPLLAPATARESHDPATAVLGADVAGIARAADYLSRSYTLVATNPPFLGRGNQTELLRNHLASLHSEGSEDLGTAFLLRAAPLTDEGGSMAMVTPQGWLFLRRYTPLRGRLLRGLRWRFVAQLGEGAFESPQAAGAMTSLVCLEKSPHEDSFYVCLETLEARSPSDKAAALLGGAMDLRSQKDALVSKHKIVMADQDAGLLLEDVADSWEGLVTADVNQFLVKFWELRERGRTWERYLTAPSSTKCFSGRDTCLRWELGVGRLVSSPTAHNFNPASVLGCSGVIVAPMRNLRVTLYQGEMFNQAAVPIIPRDQGLVPALWAYCSSDEFSKEVRRVNQKLKVDSGYFLQVPFNVERWRKLAEAAGPLPEPWSDDPTQWLFEGRPEVATESLQVVVARLVGYRWPEQAESDDLDAFTDADGIVCLPSAICRWRGTRRWSGAASAGQSVRRRMVAGQGEGAVGTGRQQEEEPRRLVARRVLQAALRAVREPAVRVARVGRSARRVLGVGELPPARPQDAGEANLLVPRSGLGRAPAGRSA